MKSTLSRRHFLQISTLSTLTVLGVPRNAKAESQIKEELTMQKKDVLFVIISEYADWEPALLAAALRGGFGMWKPAYDVKTVSLTDKPVLSIGGFRVLPDYTIDKTPEDYAALVLIGGTSWHDKSVEAVLPLINEAIHKNIPVGGICDASLFLAMHGFLDRVEHTFIDKSLMDNNPKYKGGNYFKDVQSAKGGNIITAKPTGYAEFARDMLLALNAAPEKAINDFYKICKYGDIPLLFNYASAG